MKAFAAAIVGVSLAGCANFGSIERRTDLPANGSDPSGKAIHLDIQQRLAIAKKEKRDDQEVSFLCAEPSPDALSSFASSLGAGGSLSGRGSASAAQAFSQAAASVGLRTQSITLMRDASYRICEAYYNNMLTPSDVKVLLSRAQDLTAAVVSIEQLTGAIVAQQAVLGGGASASSGATMLSNAEALAKTKELETKAEESLAKAEKDLEEAKARRSDAPDPAADDLNDEERKARQENVVRLDDEVQRAKTLVELRSEQVEVIRKTRAAIAQQLDSSITLASASATSSGSLHGGSTVSKFDKETAEAVSKAVETISIAMLEQTYVVEECMAMLSQDNWAARPEPLLLTCYDAIRAAASKGAAQAEAARQEFSKQLTGAVPGAIQLRREEAASQIDDLSTEQRAELARRLKLTQSDAANLRIHVANTRDGPAVEKILSEIRAAKAAVPDRREDQ